MKKENLLEKGTKFLEENASTILSGVGMVGTIMTAIVATNDTIKAVKILEGNETKKEVVKKTWKCYIPTVICAGATVACIFGANKISMNKIMTLTTLYSLNEKRFKNYKEKVTKVVGEKKSEVINDEVAKDDILKNPIPKMEVSDNETVCFDQLTGRYFKSSIEHIKRIIGDYNEILLQENGYVSINDIYIAWGLAGVSWGDAAGWDMGTNGTITPKYSAQMASIDGEERPIFCIELDPTLIDDPWE